VLLIDPGIDGNEMAGLAQDLREMNQPVVAGFSTHPHWDHLLWHTQFGSAPRYGTARGAATIRTVLSDPGWKDRVAHAIPPDLIEDIPLDLLGLIAGLPAETDRAYLQALRDAGVGDLSDPRLGPSAYGRNFLPFVHERQLQHLTG
jgi:hypothetical protein